MCRSMFYSPVGKEVVFLLFEAPLHAYQHFFSSVHSLFNLTWELTENYHLQLNY